MVLLVLRLIQYQVIEHAPLKARLIGQNQSVQWVIPKRGTIYDRSGDILARSIPRQSVFYAPFKDDPPRVHREVLVQLQRTLDLSADETGKIRERIDKGDPFVWIKRKVDSRQAQAVHDLSLRGVSTMEENQRYYPHGWLAAHVIGRVNIDDEGASGIEYKYNDILMGDKGKRIALVDARRREYQFEIIQAPVDGRDLILTIDETIQYIAEKELDEAVRMTDANWGVIIVSQPRSGDILAMANTPSFDLNSPPASLLTADRIKAIHQTYDPGSTFKVITASAALESGAVGLDDTFDCSAQVIRVAGKTFRDHHPFGLLTFPQVIIHSSNVGTIQVSLRMDPRNFCDIIQKFGIGLRSGIDLPAEEYGLYRPFEQWTTISPASIAIGYEVSATPLQVLQAVNVIANRGLYITPRVVRSIQADQQERQEREVQRRVISEATAAQMAAILEGVVGEGTGKQAAIPGLTVAGKTGTAQKFDPNIGAYSATAHSATFAGYVSNGRPLFSIIVVIDEPKGLYYGGQVAAPLFRNVALGILRSMGISGTAPPAGTIVAAKQRGEDGP